MLTGHPPFEGTKPLQVIFAHAHDPVVPPSSRRPEIPADLDRVILRCLEKSPADRFQSAAELEEAFDSCESAGLWTREHATRWWQECEREAAVV
jgi:serine/threonine-protein kinase